MDTLEEIISRSTMDEEDILALLDEETETEDMDDIEEEFYYNSVEEIAEKYGIELEEEEEDDDDEE
jgi:hypothetical protein